MAFNEDSRVKIPAILHLVRLGYRYIPRKEHAKRREASNIFPDIFLESIARINPLASELEINRLLEDIELKLDYEDLGREFFKMLTSTSGMKLIDFANFQNNQFHVTTELTCRNGEEEFRPDVTIFINGMPLVFVEVKRPNNKEGILAERKRINDRYRNKKFRRFANITQLMLFSNNMEYEDGVIEPLQGAFYACTSYSELLFHYFREEERPDLHRVLQPEVDELENVVLRDNHIQAIKHSPEFITNKNPETPTNRILTSLLQKDRLAFMLRYGMTYVEEETDGKPTLNKHIMRYPQVFATKAIERKLNEGATKGIIWHTQGSGKTALAYYNVKFLTDYFQAKNIIPKFYFIVDRLDLANQATSEFSSRGLEVNRVNSRAEFLQDIGKVSTVHGSSGEREMSVINIQKFTEETVTPKDLSYNLNIQRIYFIDEAHRSYNPKGNFLANLLNSDKAAIKIALTGTPLLRDVMGDFDSKAIFGDYIHKYYYNQSIADGYTLRLIREGIDTTYKMEMKEVMEHIQVMKGDITKSQVFAHEKFVKPMLAYILRDLKEFRWVENDPSLGAMVVCDTSEQAKQLFRLFEEEYGVQVDKEEDPFEVQLAANAKERYINDPPLKAALILHDVGTKEGRKGQIGRFKAGEIDILFVYNMLLTGFDAKRLKKLYLARVVTDHNLLQTLTRVNRPYKNYRYGYVVDFADITKAFKETNDNYFRELQNQLGDEMTHYDSLFKSPEEIEKEIQGIQEALFRYDTKNAENFNSQVAQMRDKAELLSLIKCLQGAKELKNRIRLQGLEELLNQLDFHKLNQLLNLAQDQLNKLNLMDSLSSGADTTNLLNTALEEIVFQFVKISEEELVIADELKGQLRQTREAMLLNFDPKDQEFVTLREELEAIFRKKNLEETNQETMRENIGLLRSIQNRVSDLNRRNNLLKAKYDQDEKYVRIHKRLLESGKLSQKEIQLHAALMVVKSKVDAQLELNNNILQNEAYFSNRYVMNLTATEFVANHKFGLDAATVKQINNLISGEYLGQYRAF